MNHPETKQDFPRQLADGIWVVGNYFFNLYLIRGKKRSALFEAGVSGVVDTVIRQLESLDVSPDYLILAHPHSDHFTGLSGLTARYPDAVLVAGRGAREFVLHPKAAAGMAAEDRFISNQLAARGLAPGRPPLQTFFFPEDHIIVDRALTLDLGGLGLNCFMVKGHAPGNLAAHVPAIRALLVSDSLGFHYPGRGFCPLFFTGYAEFVSTLDRLAALRPTLIGPAHQGPLGGPLAQRAVAQAKQAALDMYDRILGDSRESDLMAAELFDRYYRAEFALYSPENISNCMQLLIKRVRQSATA
ncbi:MAG: MBL fold metallo-hydrolase [Desulfosarcinaceae bacterium]